MYYSTDMVLSNNDSDEEIYDFVPNDINFNETVRRLANYASRSNWSVDYLEDLDTSEYPFPNVLWHKKSPQEIAIKCCLMLFVGAIGIFLNTIILTIIAKNRWLWTASHYLVANLALVDMLTLLFCPWLWLARDFHQQYILGNFGCRFEGFLQAKFLLNSVGAVMLVSYDRLAAAALNADARITKAAAPKLIVCTWICASGLSLPWILKRTYFERQWLDYLETFCVEDIVFMTPYWHIITTILVWVPIGLMVVAYGAIMWRLERSARALQTQGGGKLWRGRGKAMRITGCVLLAAMVCRVPYTALHYWRNHLIVEINAVDGAYSKMWWAANFLIYVNCTINPLIYGFTNIRFRRAMDMTPGVSCFKFGSWCCVCTVLKKKVIQEEDKNTEKIFVIDSTPRQNKKITYLIRNMLHINKDTLVFSVPKTDEISNKIPTRITPLKNENIL